MYKSDASSNIFFKQFYLLSDFTQLSAKEIFFFFIFLQFPTQWLITKPYLDGRNLNSVTVFVLWAHTYIIGHYKPLVRIINLVSHKTYVVCVNFWYISGGTYSLKSTPNDRFFWETFSWQFLFMVFSFLPKNVHFISKNVISCLFLENVSPSKRVICFILNNLHFPMV